MTDRQTQFAEHPAPDCDAPHPSLYLMPDGSTRCRCVICSRCNRHTGNAHLGHYWSWCGKTKQTEGFHFCCPDLPCEYPEKSDD